MISARVCFAATGAAALLAALAPTPIQQTAPLAPDPVIMSALRWRNIGPLRGGRAIAVSGVKGRRQEAYFGATGGGLWKTTDGGENWAPVTDGQIASASVGAVAVSESNPDIVFIGMGESCIRGNIMPGDGMYKSTDAGKTWKHIGFREGQNISKIRVHPTNPDIVYAAVFGRYSVSHDERGIYKSTDGGATWKRVLFRNGKTPAIDISIDRANPNIIYAALWEAYRVEYSMSSGGPGSGLFKSTDGGETWTELTRNPGMPAGVIGRIGIATTPDPNRVYALVENENGGLFSTDNAGATWTLVNANRNIRQRAFYYTHVVADPKNKDVVYGLNTSNFRSADGGKTMPQWGGGSHGDNHDLWIDPDDPQHMVVGNDGGGAVSTQGGNGWTAQDFSTSQLYHIAATAHVPYHVCGAQQDASTICVPTNEGLGGGGRGGRGGGGGGGGGRGGAAADPLANTYSAGGSEDGFIAPDPKDPDVFFAGGNNGTFMTRLNRRTGQVREVNPYVRMFSGEPASALKERWQWTYPIVFSPVDPRIIYTGSQKVWKTTTQGQSWDAISGDLTRHDPKTLGHSGGPITGDMNGPEVYATVFSIGPSKRNVNTIWAGSDDGLIHVTRDGGKTWANVTPRDMPAFGRVSMLDASAFDSGAVYAAVKLPLLDDYKPYIFRTHDFGRTWTKIVTGIRADDYVHSIREDPTRRGLLYAATQHGMYFSYDDGDHWQSLSLNLPDIPVSDIVVGPNDISIATHGRGFYVLDDIAPLRQFTAAVASAPDVYLFAPPPAIRSATGASVTYWLKKPAQMVTLDFLDARGGVIRTLRSDTTGAGAAAGGGGGGGGGGRGGRGGGVQTLAVGAGLNRATWDLQYPGAVTFPGMVLWGASTNGPAAPPGTYRVRLTVDGRVQTQSFTVKRHPLYTDVSDADLQAQFDHAIRIRDKVSEANNAVITIRNLKAQIADRLAKSPDAQLHAKGDALTKALSAVEEDVYQVRNQSGQDPLNFPIKTNNRLASLLGVVIRGDGRPLANTYPIFTDLVAELKAETDVLDKLKASDLVSLNAELRRLGLDPVTVAPLVRM